MIALGKIFKVRRRACAFRGCSKAAPYTPELIIAREGKESLIVELQINVCESCRRLPKRAFCSDEGWRHILFLMGSEYGPVKPGLSPDSVGVQFRTDDGKVIPWSKDPKEA